MINFKNHKIFSFKKGFTLAEVLIAMVITGIMVLSILRLAGNLLKLSTKSHNVFDRTILLINFINETEKDREKLLQTKTITKIIDKPQTNLSYTLESAAEKEKFKDIKDLYFKKVTASWPEYGIEKKQEIKGLIFIREKKADETKKP